MGRRGGHDGWRSCLARAQNCAGINQRQDKRLRQSAGIALGNCERAHGTRIFTAHHFHPRRKQ
jgi:hypothetical protein